MKKTLTDLSQLNAKDIVVKPEADTTPKTPAPQDAAPGSPAYDAVEETLAWFARGRQGARPKAGSSCTDETRSAAEESDAAAESGGAGRIAELEARLESLKTERDTARLRAENADALLGEKLLELERVGRECDRLRSECACLQGEARKSERTAAQSAAPAEPVAAPDGATEVVLRIPRDFEAMFPDAVREFVLAALADSLRAAKQAERDRRAAVLERLLECNPSSGELRRREAELKQVAKNSGSFADAQTLAQYRKLGLRLISGRTHWKLEYGGVRVTIAKTPSDRRAADNTATVLINKCL